MSSREVDASLRGLRERLRRRCTARSFLMWCCIWRFWRVRCSPAWGLDRYPRLIFGGNSDPSLGGNVVGGIQVVTCLYFRTEWRTYAGFQLSGFYSQCISSPFGVMKPMVLYSLVTFLIRCGSKGCQGSWHKGRPQQDMLEELLKA